MFFHSGQAFLIFIEIRQMFPDTLHHRFCIQMFPHDGMSITNFRQTSAISSKYSFSKLHSFYHRQPKTFSFTRKQERFTVPIQPNLFTLSDYICQKHISDESDYALLQHKRNGHLHKYTNHIPGNGALRQPGDGNSFSYGSVQS